MRDKLDDLSKVILDPVNLTDDKSSVEEGLINLGHGITHLADARDWETTQIETKILTELGQYDQVCKALREEVKINGSIRNKEVLRKRAAEQKRGSTVLRADRDFEKIVEDFEEQRNKDLKAMMMSFVNIQLKVHLEGVNLLTDLYRKLKDIDCSEDAVKFRDSFLDSKVAVQPKVESTLMNKSRSQSMSALNTLMHPSNPFRRLSNKHQQAERLNRSQEDIVEAKEPPKILLADTEESAEEQDDEEDEDDNSDEDTDQEHFPRNHQLHVPKYTK